jgi:uncharacterized membrane protein YdcZ (DUF606 family)
VALLAVGLHRIGYDLDLRQYGAGHWHASFYITGLAHSILGGSAWKPTVWRAFAAYAVGTVLLARELGAALLTALVITGQLVCSVILDHFGWVGFTEHAAGRGRIVGCFLMVAGFILIARY